MAAAVVQEHVYGSAIASEILSRAVVKVDPINPNAKVPQYARIFRDGDDVERGLTPDELSVLFTHYTIVQRSFGPYLADIQTDDELSAWVKVLAEGGKAHPLASLSSSQQQELCLLLARRAWHLSDCLASQQSNLPESLESTLSNWQIGTGFYGKLSSNFVEMSSEFDDETEPVVPNPAPPKPKRRRGKKSAKKVSPAPIAPSDDVPADLNLASEATVPPDLAVRLAQKLSDG
jgi:hypothetical protein